MSYPIDLIVHSYLLTIFLSVQRLIVWRTKQPSTPTGGLFPLLYQGMKVSHLCNDAGKHLRIGLVVSFQDKLKQ